MKKVICLFTLLCFVFLNSQGVLANKESKSLINSKPIKIRINFDIAAPRFECESGFGICNASGGVNRIAIGRTVEAECYIEDQVLVMSIEKSNMSRSVREEIDNLHNWRISDNLDIPKEWLEEMKISSSLSIPAGNYEIDDLKESVTVNFKLK